MSARALVCGAAVAAIAMAACLPAQDDPSFVHDLRVLGAQNAPPELMAPVCPTLDGGFPLEDLVVFASPVQFAGLIADPNGGGRAIHYDLFACASTGDKTCANIDDTLTLASGDLAPDAGTDWIVPIVAGQPGAEILANGTPLLLRVLQEDPNQGFGGIRMPLVLHVTAGSEEIFAQKLMVFSCQLFPDQAPAGNPVLPGVQLQGIEWPDGSLPVMAGAGPFALQADDFSSLERTYVEAAFDLSEVHAVESWKITWYTEYGTISPSESGGADVTFGASTYAAQWTPPTNSTERDVNFWFAVRNGRGGMSWMMRRLHYKP